VDALKAVGWSDEAIYDAINACALFNFFNRWIDANGVGHHAPEIYAFTGVRLSQGSYAEPAPTEEKTG
jgi:hypothetical protein